MNNNIAERVVNMWNRINSELKILKHAWTWIKRDNPLATDSNGILPLPLSTDPTILTDLTERSNLTDDSLIETD
jgi:hypothetical protein